MATDITAKPRSGVPALTKNPRELDNAHLYASDVQRRIEEEIARP